MNKLTGEDIRKLKHMVGADAEKCNRGYRNRYFAAASDFEVMNRLVSAGFAVECGEVTGDCVLYTATREGMEHIGFNKKQISRALNENK